MCIWHGAIDKAKKRLWWEMILDQLPAMDKLSEDGFSGKHEPAKSLLRLWPSLFFLLFVIVRTRFCFIPP